MLLTLETASTILTLVGVGRSGTQAYYASVRSAARLNEHMGP